MNVARAQGTQPDLILRNGQFTTLDRSNPQANAVAIKDGRFVAVGQEREVMALAGSGSKVIDLKGRRAIPGLIQPHPHHPWRAQLQHGITLGRRTFLG